MIETSPAPTRRHWPDAWMATGLFAFALTVGVLYCVGLERTKPSPEPWTRELGAAVAFACGRGFVDTGYTLTPSVAAFLDKKIDRISCGDLPSDLPVRPPNFTQALYRYMTLAVGMTWRILGVSWFSLSALLGLLYAFTALGIYGLFRLATTRGPALIGTVILTISPLQLRYLPQLRDYAKAPFLVALILILAGLVIRPFTRRRLLVSSACYGTLAGIGFGFRNDLMIAALPFVVTVLAFLPIPFRAYTIPRIAALGLCALSFVVCAWPIIAAYRTGSNSGHVALLGLMTHFNAPLGVTTSVYDWGAHYDDGFAVKLISSFSQRVHHRAISVLSPEYDRTMVEYLLLIGRHWPADLLIRAYASILRVVELPFQARLYTTAAPPAVGGVAGVLYEAWVGLLGHLSGAGVVTTVLAIAAVASASVRVATWLFLSLLYFAGYPALQFDARHFFFLEFIPWLALVFLCAEITGPVARSFRVRGGVPTWARAHAAPATHGWIRGRRAMTFVLALAIVVGGPVVALRAYQQRHLTMLIQNYLDAPTETLTLRSEPASDGRVLIRPSELSQSTELEIRAEYLVVDVTRSHCTAAVVPLMFRYVTMDGYTDLSQRIDVSVPGSDAPCRVFFPIYYSPGGYFAGIEVDDRHRACMARIRRVTRIDRTPILLNLTLPPDWRERRLYQTLASRRAAPRSHE